MKVVIHGVHVTVSPELKAHIQSQLADPLAALFPTDAAELDVHLVDVGNGTRGGVDKECRITVHIPKMQSLHLTEVSEDFFKSVSLASHRLDHVAKRHLERTHSHDVGLRPQ